MSDLVIRLFGGFAATWRQAPLAFRSDKVRGLLAYLVMRPNEAIARETLAGLFFPGYADNHGRKNLNLLLTRLRQALAPVQAAQPEKLLLISDQQAVQLVGDDCRLWVDTVQLEKLHNECEQHRHERLETCPDCLYRLRQMVTLYQGDFLAGFSLGDAHAFDEWRLWQQEYLLNIVLSALTSLVTHALATGQPVDAEQFARRHIQLSPWQERPHHVMMQALAQQGKVTAALRHFDVYRKLLAEELGASPSAEMWACYHQLLHRAAETAAPPAPGLDPSLTPASPSPMAHEHLPQPGTPFFGRTALLEALSQAVLNPANRLITLTGAGGMGKTRLAIALARHLQDQFTHGATFVPLARVAEADEGEIAQAIGATAGYIFTGTDDPVTELLAYLQGQHRLLILDNFEHLLVQAPLVNRLLAAAPQLTILVTSRYPLSLPGEYSYPVKGLELPRHKGDAAAASVQLFAERASRTGSNFKLDDTTLPYVVRICRFLQGWPLALELAAAWVHSLPLAEIETTLVQHLDRLRTHYQDVAERHRSITAVLDWSYALLAPPAQKLLTRLAVFQGGWTEAAAVVVVEATPEMLMHLHQHALIEKQPDGRLTMHELIRQFALAHLPVQDDWAARHSHYYLAWLKAQEGILYGPEPITALPLIETELNNIRKAWHWAVKKGGLTELGACLDALGRYYSVKGLATTAVFDLGTAAEQVETYATGQPAPQAHAYLALAGQLWAEQARFYARLGEVEEALAAADRAWALGEKSEDAATLSRAGCVRGTVFHLLGQTQAAREALFTGARLARDADQPRLLVQCLRQLVRPLVETHHYLDEARRLAQQQNDSWLKNIIAQSMSGVSFYEGRLWQAYQDWQESLFYSRQFANRMSIARLENNLGDLARRFGDYDQAFVYQQSAWQTCRELNDSITEAYVLEGLSRLYWQKGQIKLAWEMVEQCETICRQRHMLGCLGYLVCTKGRLHFLAGEVSQARSAYKEAIACSSACDHPQMAMEAYAGLAEIEYQQGNLAAAGMWCDVVLAFLAEGQALEGFTETSWIYLTCVQVLAALRDKRARLILDRAQAEIQMLAEQITDETIRQLFLQVASNQAVLSFSLTTHERSKREPALHGSRPIRAYRTNQAATNPSTPSLVRTLSH